MGNGELEMSWNGEWKFLWQSQMLVLGREKFGSNSSPRHWLWGGEVEVLMAV